MIKLFFAVLLLPLPALAACGESSAAVNAKWSQPAVKLKASLDKGKAPTLPLETKVELALSPDATKKDAFTGFAKVSAVKGGAYEIALGERAWVSLVDAGTGASLKPASFKKGEASTGAVKTLSFPLAAGRLYFFQVSSAKAPALAMLVHASEE